MVDAGGDLGHRRGLHPRHLARRRRDHDPGGGRRHAAQPDLQPDSSRRRPSPSYIVQVALGDLPHGSIGYQTIFAAGLTLMLMTLVFNIARATVLRKRFREAY
ncbi:MAG: hypothetical protein MZW92_79230 [Comamonadaceae bacterium]|nr:hypothetical protein [Comamonadaceae bacterium]